MMDPTGRDDNDGNVFGDITEGTNFPDKFLAKQEFDKEMFDIAKLRNATKM